MTNLNALKDLILSKSGVPALFALLSGALSFLAYPIVKAGAEFSEKMAAGLVGFAFIFLVSLGVRTFFNELLAPHWKAYRQKTKLRQEFERLSPDQKHILETFVVERVMKKFIKCRQHHSLEPYETLMLQEFVRAQRFYDSDEALTGIEVTVNRPTYDLLCEIIPHGGLPLKNLEKRSDQE
jgi:hypothetical protein